MEEQLASIAHSDEGDVLRLRDPVGGSVHALVSCPHGHEFQVVKGEVIE